MSYKAKGTPPGLDVKNAIDYLQSFNSGWPLLKVHETNTSSGSISHNLGYFPMYFTTHPSGAFAGSGSVDQGIFREWSVNQSSLIRDSGSGSRRYFIFRLNLLQNFEAEITDGLNNSPGESGDNYVFKLSKPGSDIRSNDMRDFALHSDTRSPLVHKVNHGPMSSSGGLLTRTVNHNLGYVPTAFAYIRPDTNSIGMNADRYYFVPPPVSTLGFFYSVDSSEVTVTADSSTFSGSPDVSVVILKDPFDKDVINVSYP